MAYPANIAFTFATQTGPIPLSELDTNFTNIATGLNGIGNGTSVLQSVTITGGSLSNVTITGLQIGANTVTDTELVPMGALTVKGNLANVTANSGNITFGTLQNYIGPKTTNINFTRFMSAPAGNVAYTGVGFQPSSITAIAAVNGDTTGGMWGQADAAGLMQSVRLNGSAYVPSVGTWTYSRDGDATFQRVSTITYQPDGFTLTWTVSGSPANASVIFLIQASR